MPSFKALALGTAGVVLAIAVGAFGLGALFADLGRSETFVERLLLLAFVYAIGCVAAGALLWRAWYLALLAAWGPVGVGVLAVTAHQQDWWILFIALAYPLEALFFSYAGSRLRTGKSRRRAGGRGAH